MCSDLTTCLESPDDEVPPSWDPASDVETAPPSWGGPAEPLGVRR